MAQVVWDHHHHLVFWPLSGPAHQPWGQRGFGLGQVCQCALGSDNPDLAFADSVSGSLLLEPLHIHQVNNKDKKNCLVLGQTVILCNIFFGVTLYIPKSYWASKVKTRKNLIYELEHACLFFVLPLLACQIMESKTYEKTKFFMSIPFLLPPRPNLLVEYAYSTIENK